MATVLMCEDWIAEAIMAELPGNVLRYGRQIDDADEARAAYRAWWSSAGASVLVADRATASRLGLVDENYALIRRGVAGIGIGEDVPEDAALAAYELGAAAAVQVSRASASALAESARLVAMHAAYARAWIHGRARRLPPSLAVVRCGPRDRTPQPSRAREIH